jgi:hypothetical protein
MPEIRACLSKACLDLFVRQKLNFFFEKIDFLSLVSLERLLASSLSTREATRSRLARY